VPNAGTREKQCHEAAQRARAKQQNSLTPPRLKLWQSVVPSQGPIGVHATDFERLYRYAPRGEPERRHDLEAVRGTTLNEEHDQLRGRTRLRNLSARVGRAELVLGLMLLEVAPSSCEKSLQRSLPIGGRSHQLVERFRVLRPCRRCPGAGDGQPHDERMSFHHRALCPPVAP
jgi:hypothetical protein